MILQKYDFSSKSQQILLRLLLLLGCLWYCKSTIFQANHNIFSRWVAIFEAVCDTAKVRFFKQITTANWCYIAVIRCLWYCKSTIFQANHNRPSAPRLLRTAVCDTAKVRFFKQITTARRSNKLLMKLFVILQKYDFSSKSQLARARGNDLGGCLWYCKSTIFQANHNWIWIIMTILEAVCDTAKVRFFKQITTLSTCTYNTALLFVILQKYDFSSKSQLQCREFNAVTAVCDTAKVRFFKQITTPYSTFLHLKRCLWYCKSTIFQANHNSGAVTAGWMAAVCDTAKVRFFKQITTSSRWCIIACTLFVILQKYDFSSKSQPFWPATTSV